MSSTEKRADQQLIAHRGSVQAVLIPMLQQYGQDQTENQAGEDDQGVIRDQNDNSSNQASAANFSGDSDLTAEQMEVTAEEGGSRSNNGGGYGEEGEVEGEEGEEEEEEEEAAAMAGAAKSEREELGGERGLAMSDPAKSKGKGFDDEEHTSCMQLITQLMPAAGRITEGAAAPGAPDTIISASADTASCDVHRYNITDRDDRRGGPDQESLGDESLLELRLGCPAYGQSPGVIRSSPIGQPRGHGSVSESAAEYPDSGGAGHSAQPVTLQLLPVSTSTVRDTASPAKPQYHAPYPHPHPHQHPSPAYHQLPQPHHPTLVRPLALSWGSSPPTSDLVAPVPPSASGNTFLIGQVREVSGAQAQSLPDPRYQLSGGFEGDQGVARQRPGSAPNGGFVMTGPMVTRHPACGSAQPYPWGGPDPPGEVAQPYWQGLVRSLTSGGGGPGLPEMRFPAADESRRISAAVLPPSTQSHEYISACRQAADVNGDSLQRPASSLMHHLRLSRPPPRRHPGFWLTLEAAPTNCSDDDEQHGAFPPLQKIFMRIRDGQMQVSVIKKYLVRKLDLSNEEEVELSCRGKILASTFTIQYVRDQLWLSTKGFLEGETLGFRSTTTHTLNLKDQIMVLSYQRHTNALTLNLLQS